MFPDMDEANNYKDKADFAVKSTYARMGKGCKPMYANDNRAYGKKKRENR